MEYEKIKKLMDDMGNSNLTSLDIDFPDGTKIRMKKDNKDSVIETISNNVIEKKQAVRSSEDKKEIDIEEDIKNDKSVEGIIVKSPMVGNFYLRPNPDAEPYVEIGKRVKKGDVLCIIEAMKLMNEIESEVDGEIVKICATDEQPVEYGSPLFIIK